MRPLLLISLGLLVFPVARAQGSSKQTPTGTSDSTGKTGGSVAPDDYKIGPQDEIRVDVWKEPEITRTVPVRPDGKISLPLLNDVQAAGLTAMQLAGTIHDGLSKYITNPQVTVTILGINSKRIFINGEVGHVGAQPLLPNMTVLQALSNAGGLNQFARPTKIYILRMEGGKQTKIPFNYKQVIKGDHPEQDILLQPGDTIVVP